MVRKVRAAVMVEPGRLEIYEFPYPEVPEENALVKIKMSGICGTDKHNYKGEIKHPTMEVPFPIIPGHENVGTIEEIGEKAATKMEVTGQPLKPGDKVVPGCDAPCGVCYWCKSIYGYPWCDNLQSYGTLMSCRNPPHLFGGWSEYMYLLPNVYVTKVPEGIPWETAVLTEPMAVAYGAISKAMQPYSIAKEGFGPGDTVVVQGVGPLGALNAIMARTVGADTVIAVDSSGYRLELARRLGVDHTINMKDIKRPEERTREVLELTNGRGADLVIECAGSPEAVIEGLEMLRTGGTYIEEGNFVDTGWVSINPHKHLCAKNVRVIGVAGMPHRGYAVALNLFKRFADRFSFNEIVTHRFPLEQAEKALNTAMGPNCMKVVIAP